MPDDKSRKGTEESDITDDELHEFDTNAEMNTASHHGFSEHEVDEIQDFFRVELDPELGMLRNKENWQEQLEVIQYLKKKYADTVQFKENPKLEMKAKELLGSEHSFFVSVEKIVENHMGRQALKEDFPKEFEQIRVFIFSELEKVENNLKAHLKNEQKMEVVSGTFPTFDAAYEEFKAKMTQYFGSLVTTKKKLDTRTMPLVVGLQIEIEELKNQIGSKSKHVDSEKQITMITVLNQCINNIKEKHSSKFFKMPASSQELAKVCNNLLAQFSPELKARAKLVAKQKKIP